MIRSLPISEKIVKIANRIAHSVIAFVSDSHAYLIKDVWRCSAFACREISHFSFSRKLNGISAARRIRIKCSTYFSRSGNVRSEFFRAWGSTDVVAARRMVDVCLDAGVTMFDTADVYSNGASEEVLGEALKGRRDKVLISTKATFRLGSGPNDVGSSRFHLLKSCDEALAD